VASLIWYSRFAVHSSSPSLLVANRELGLGREEREQRCVDLLRVRREKAVGPPLITTSFAPGMDAAVRFR